MKSEVYFTNLRTGDKKNLLDKLEILVKAAGLFGTILPNELVAIKLHFGEPGNTAFIRPVFIRKLVEILKSRECIPFLTDANTLYSGDRSDAVNHLISAIRNGFAYSVIEAPIIIADGLRGKTETEVRVDMNRFKKVYLGTEVVQADSLISIAHFKCHELSGFGGTIKNLGMGCASRRGKLAQHSTLSPKIIRKRCEACKSCASHCSQNAISIVEVDEKTKKAKINNERCIGCGECIVICPNDAIVVQWNQSIPVFLENMVEYTAGVLKNKKGKAFFINFIMDVSPACDCISYNDAPIVKDIGIMASIDPVAIDQASADLVNKEAALAGTCLKRNLGVGEDKFKGVYPEVDWEIKLDYAEKLGLGVRDYELINL